MYIILSIITIAAICLLFWGLLSILCHDDADNDFNDDLN
jgi:hypothetical protein